MDSDQEFEKFGSELEKEEIRNGLWPDGQLEIIEPKPRIQVGDGRFGLSNAARQVSKSGWINAISPSLLLCF